MKRHESKKIQKYSFLTKKGHLIYSNLNLTCFYRNVCCKIRNVFYWLAYFNCEYLRSQRLETVDFDQNSPFDQKDFLKAIMISLKFWLVLKRPLVCKIENYFHWRIYFHSIATVCIDTLVSWQYFRAQRFYNVVFWPK